MSAKHTHAYNIIDIILWNDWDPIGINEASTARDEYQDYVPGIFNLASSNADEETITWHLLNIETAYMGLPGNTDNCRNVARKIIAVFKG